MEPSRGHFSSMYEALNSIPSTAKQNINHLWYATLAIKLIGLRITSGMCLQWNLPERFDRRGKNTSWVWMVARVNQQDGVPASQCLFPESRHPGDQTPQVPSLPWQTAPLHCRTKYTLPMLHSLGIWLHNEERNCYNRVTVSALSDQCCSRRGKATGILTQNSRCRSF